MVSGNVEFHLYFINKNRFIYPTCRYIFCQIDGTYASDTKRPSRPGAEYYCHTIPPL